MVGLDADGRPAGFVTVDPASGYLDQLCVRPGEQGSGLAGALLDEAKRLSPGALELDVNEANERACRFYEREGFVAVTRGASAQSGLPTLRLRWTRAADAPLCHGCHDAASRLRVAPRRRRRRRAAKRATEALLSPGEANHAQPSHSVAWREPRSRRSPPPLWRTTSSSPSPVR